MYDLAREAGTRIGERLLATSFGDGISAAQDGYP
jgi:hypothetical protein